jgi:hypothetical protein
MYVCKYVYKCVCTHGDRARPKGTTLYYPNHTLEVAGPREFVMCVALDIPRTFTLTIPGTDNTWHTADSRQQAADSRQHTADIRQQTVHIRHQTADSWE